MEQPHAVTHANRPPKSVFIALAFVIFSLLFLICNSLGFVPYYIDGTAPASAETISQSGGMHVFTRLSDITPQTLLLDASGRIVLSGTSEATDANAVLPTRLSIPAIDLDLAIQNPSTTDVAALDALLANGPARYAASATLGKSGNVILFAHSSHLPVVHNQMYKAFNRIPELQSGDTITLTGSDGRQYLYEVKSVTRADVNDDVELSLAKNVTKLTLVTCDTLTGKSARFVLDASFVGVVNAH